MHARQTIHRDVKAANICLMADHSAKLIDCGVVPRGTVWVATPDAVAMPVAKLRGESAYAGKMPQGKEKVNASEHDVYVIEIAPGMDAVVVLALVIGWEQFEVIDADRASRSAWIGHSPKNVTFQAPSPSGRAAIEC